MRKPYHKRHWSETKKMREGENRKKILKYNFLKVFTIFIFGVL